MPSADPPAPPRIGLLCLFGECHFLRAPVPAEEHRWLAYFEGPALLAAMDDPGALIAPELRGFLKVMQQQGSITPLPLVYAIAESGPPLEEKVFQSYLAAVRRRLVEVAPLDAVFIVGHGAVTATDTLDVDGALYSVLREHVGEHAPIVSTLDLHGKVSPAMVERSDALVAYKTDPHTDMMERGEEAGRIMVRMLAGERMHKAHVRLPLVMPESGLSSPTSAFREIIAEAQAMVPAETGSFSMLPGYPFNDTVDTGFSILVYDWSDPARAHRIALELAERVWRAREGFRSHTISIEDAVALCVQASNDKASERVLLADVGDNPGGAGTGNTCWLLEALMNADVKNFALGMFYDPELVAQAEDAGAGVGIKACFNRNANDPYVRPLTVTAVVERLFDGEFVARKGVVKGIPLSIGRCARLRVGGLQVVVCSRRMQVLAAEQFEAAGIDLSRVRGLVVKSRAHYRASLDEFFATNEMHDVDTPGLTAPNLAVLPYKHLRRPAFPMDADAAWAPFAG